jgi:Mg-chelatase subunit ChlD/tetratricopeptide (TPR) repeat protein
LAHRWSFNGKLVAENAPTSTAPISVNSAGFVNNGQIDTGVEGTYAQSQQEKARSDAVNPTGLFPGTFFPTSPSGIPGANTLISPSTSDGNDRQGQRQVVTAIGGRIDKLGEAEVTTASGRESQAQVITGTYFGGINAESKDRVDGLSALTTQAGAKPVEAEHEKAGKDLALRTDSDSDPRLQGNDLYLRLQSTNAIMPAQAMHGSESSSVHVIDLKNADPAEVNKTLADLFPEAQQNGSMPLATRQQSVVQVPSKSAIPADATEVLTDNFSNGQLPGQNQRRASETAARGGRTEIALPQVSASGGTFRAVQPESSSSRSVNPTGYFPGTFYPDAPIQAGTEISKPILALKSAYPSAGKQGAADMLSQAQQRDSLARAEATGIVLPTSAGTTRDYPNSTTPGPVQATYDPQTGKFIVITDDKTFASVSSVLMAIDRPKIETNVDSQDKQMLQTRFGSIPTPADLAKSSTYQSNQVAIAENVQNGRFYLEMGDLDNAEAALKQALTKEPSNVAALHYLELAAERRAANSDIRNQLSARKALVQVESDWDLQQRSRQATNKSNAYALRDGSATGKGREEILSKLKSTKVESVKMPGVPLREALANLTDIARNRDPQGTGINFFVDPRALTQPGALDANGVPLPSGADIDRIADSKVQLDLVNGRLEDVLDAIVKNSNPPLKYEIRDSAVMFSLKDGDSATANQKVQAKPATPVQTDPVVPKPALQPPVPQPEVLTRENAFSTFSLNVSDVSFKLAGASLDKGALPEPGAVRAEEFINAFDYRDPEAGPGVPIAFASERAHDPFAQNRDFLRFSVKTAAAGRQSNRPLNIVLLLDNSGSMERADRVQIIHEALRVLASQLKPQDRVSVITFSRLARLWVDGIAGNQAGDVLDHVGSLTPEGGTNLEEAMKLAYATALRHYLANGMNRVVMLTDGAANLGNVDPATLKQMVETQRQQGIALDCFGVGWEGFNDDLLEELSRNGDGRYGFINSPEEASTEFAGQLAGALQVAASDVKVQVEFNPQRVSSYRQIGYAKHQLTKEQFRDNTVDAAEIAAAEAGNALYTVETNPAGEGPVATVRVRYRDPGTRSYYEKEWVVPYNGPAGALDQGSAAMRLAAASAAFAEWLAQSPFASEVSPDRLLGILNGVPEVYGADARPKKLETMIREAKSITGQ